MGLEHNTVVLIDPDDSIREALGDLLHTIDIPMLGYPHAEAFLAAGSHRHAGCSCLLMEARLPGLGSLALLRQLREADSLLPVVFLVSTLTCDIADQALDAGATDIMRKPLANDSLIRRLKRLMGRSPE